MGRTIQRPSGLIVGVVTFVLVTLVTLAPASATIGSSPPAAAGGLTVELPPGEVLPPGSYDVVIHSQGRPIQAKVVVASPSNGQPPSPGAGDPAATGQPGGIPAAQELPGDSGPAAGNDGGIPVVALVVLVLVLLLAGGVLLYLKVLVPRGHVRSYRQALALLDADEYALALPQLTRMEGKLPERLRADARFFIAFALFRLDNLDEAEHRLAALHREKPKDIDVAYLLAYLRTARRDYDRAESVLEAIESTGQLGSGAARKLYGVVKFQRAVEAFRDGRIDAAAELFEKVEKLGDFSDKIPADLRNRHIVLGTQALFDRDAVGARRHFESLERSASRADAAEARASAAASAKLGLALAAWIDDVPEPWATVEGLLVDAARLLAPRSRLELPWPEHLGEVDVTDRLAVLEGEAERTADTELDRVLRDVHFLRGVAVLRSWLDSEQPAAVGTYLSDAFARFACARERDAEFSDIYLVVGLLRYYLATTDREREHGVALLRQAQRLGTRDPEVLQILNHYKRIRQTSRNAVDAYLQVLDRYLRDGTVREQVRIELISRLSRYGKVRDWDTRPELTRVRAVAPTVAEMNDRSDLLRERVSQLMASQHGAGADDLAGALDLVHRLERESKALSEQARLVEERESALLVLVGDRLLADSER